MHLAEINVARLKYPLEDPRVSEFVDNLDRVNAVAERMDGFVWRFEEAAGDPAAALAFGDPMLIVNMSVWRDAESLERFVWNTVHKRIYEKKQEWFSLMQSHHFAMWRVEESHVPTLEEARERLDHLDRNGDTDFAFGWTHLPHIKLWQQARCA